MKKFEDLTFANHYIFEKVLQNSEIKAIQTAKNALAMDFIEQIISLTGLPTETVKQLAQEISITT